MPLRWISSEIRSAPASSRSRIEETRSPPYDFNQRSPRARYRYSFGNFGFVRLDRNIHLLARCANWKLGISERACRRFAARIASCWKHSRSRLSVSKFPRISFRYYRAFSHVTILRVDPGTRLGQITVKRLRQYKPPGKAQCYAAATPACFFLGGRGRVARIDPFEARQEAEAR